MQAKTEMKNRVIQEVNDKTTSPEGEKKALQDELGTARAHLKPLQVLVNVNDARMALSLNDIDGVEAALVESQQ